MDQSRRVDFIFGTYSSWQ